MSDKDLFLKSFEEKLKSKLDKKALNDLSNNNIDDEELKSSDYEQFRSEAIPKTAGFYEVACNFSEKILPIKPDEKTAEKLKRYLYLAHLGATPTGIQSLSIVSSLMILILGFTLLLFYSGVIGFGIIILGIGAYFAVQNIPDLLAKKARSDSSNEIIVAIFYIVAFMRFNSNFELAVNFAANYLNGNLSLDFKRVLWELENAKYPNIKSAFDNYLEDWRDDNLEFLESIYLIESSLYESEEFRRISLLDKSLDIILQGSYEKILHYAQDLRGKVSAFNMIGIVLPILGLIILPLAASFGDPKSTWQIVFLLYNLILPATVTYFGFRIIFNKPGAPSSIRPPEENKNLQKAEIKISKDKSIYIDPKFPAIGIFVVFMLIGISPFLLSGTGIEASITTALEGIFEDEKSPYRVFQTFTTIDPKDGPAYEYGPYGVFPGIISLFIPLGIAFSLGFYLKTKYKGLLNLRDKTKALEKQFTSATFQLGNRINEGISAELAFGAVAETMRGTEAGNFFSKIDSNIKFSGMSVENAIFDSEKGAIVDYPSDLIISSMKIFIKSIEKGPEIGAKTLIDLSKYLSEIHLSHERMIDLLAESLGSMKSQASFLAPIISAVVISIVSLVSLIIGTLSDTTAEISAQTANENLANIVGNSIPTYWFQASVGIYIVSLIAILILIVSNLENGNDPINTKYQIGNMVQKGIIKYSLLVAVGIIGFAFIGAQVLASL